MTIAFGIRMMFIGFVLATNREYQLDVTRTLGQEFVNMFWSIIYCWILAQFWIFFESGAKKVVKIVVTTVLAVCIILPVGFLVWVVRDSGYRKKNEKLLTQSSAQIKFLDTHYTFLTSLDNAYFNNTTGEEQLVVEDKTYEGENLELCIDQDCTEYDSTKTYKNESVKIQKLVEITPKESFVGSLNGYIFTDGIYAFDNKYDPYGTLKVKNCQNSDVKIGSSCLEYLDKYKDDKKLFVYTEK